MGGCLSDCKFISDGVDGMGHTSQAHASKSKGVLRKQAKGRLWECWWVEISKHQGCVFSQHDSEQRLAVQTPQLPPRETDR